MVTVIDSWSDEHGASVARGLFSSAFQVAADGVWAAPGRVNLIGEHVDYNGGICLPIALPHKTFSAFRRREDDVVRLVSGLDPDQVWYGRVGEIAPGAVSGWVSYAAGPVWAMAQGGYRVGGFDAAIESRVPLGAGLSSSAAVECAVAVALSDNFAPGLTTDDAGRAELAQLCVRAENEVAGAPTGGMDQAASLRCTVGHALHLDTLDGSTRQVPLDLEPDGLRLLVIDTRAEHALADGQYAQRRDACERAAHELGVRYLREVTDTDAALARLRDETDRRRVRHVLSEIARTSAFVRLLEAGRLREAGPLMDASHASLRDDYQVSCPELDVAVEAARGAGAIGARMTGGGFGGSAIALFPTDRIQEGLTAVAEAFNGNGFASPAFLTATAGPAAGRVA